MVTMNIPFNLVTALTYRCNIKCKHCFAGSPLYDPATLRKSEMNTDQWRTLLMEAGEIGVHEIYFGGGEPFIRDDFFDLVQTARTAGLGVTLTTNGTLVTAEKASRLAEMGVECVEVSIDGTRALHDFLRGGSGIFDKATQAIRHFTNAGIYVIGSMTVSRANLSEMLSVYEEIRACGAREILYMRFVPTGSGKHNREQLYITGDEFRTAVATIANRFSEDLVEHTRVQSNSDGFFYPHAGCIPGRTYCFIRPNGDVTPCNPLIFPQTRCGNVRENTLKHIWGKGDGFKRVRGISVKDLKGCYDCEKREICSGGCRILCSLYKDNCQGNCTGCQYSLSCNEATGLCGKKYMYYVRIRQPN